MKKNIDPDGIFLKQNERLILFLYQTYSPHPQMDGIFVIFLWWKSGGEFCIFFVVQSIHRYILKHFESSCSHFFQRRIFSHARFWAFTLFTFWIRILFLTFISGRRPGVRRAGFNEQDCLLAALIIRQLNRPTEQLSCACAVSNVSQPPQPVTI